MKHIVINGCLLFIFSITNAQKIEKETIYIQFKWDKKCPGDQKFFLKNEI